MNKTRIKKLADGEIIPLTYDFMFASIFNREENIDILEEFISFYFNIELKEVRGNLKLLSREELEKNTLIEEAKEAAYEQGAYEKQKEIVKKLLNKKRNKEEISEITELTIEEIDKIEKEMNNILN